MKYSEIEKNKLQTLIDNVVDENVCDFTKNYFYKIENIFIEKNEIIEDVFFKELEYIKTVLDIMNPLLSKDSDYFVELRNLFFSILY